MSVNKAILIGRPGKDPEISYSRSATAVCRFSLATNEKFKDREGTLQEHTEWHSIVCFAKLAEVCGQYLCKGREVYLEGSIRTRKWEDQNGNERTSFNIVARQMQMLSSSNGNGAKPKAELPKPIEAPSEEDNPFAEQGTTDSDIPF